MTVRTPLDDFRTALAGAARAIAREGEVELAFGGDRPEASANQLRIPAPPRNLPALEVAQARGQVDAMALTLRHHDARIHATQRPADPVAASCFDALERGRIARDNFTGRAVAAHGKWTHAQRYIEGVALAVRNVQPRAAKGDFGQRHHQANQQPDQRRARPAPGHVAHHL